MLNSKLTTRNSYLTLWKALASGAVGAVSLTLIHETARQFIPRAPRVDILGMRGIVQALRAVDQTPPQGDALYGSALVGDLVSNAVYYSLVGLGDGERALLRSAFLGGLAGVGAVVLPGPLGLGSEPSGRTLSTMAMTVAWYLAGGLAAGATFRYLHRPGIV